MVTNYLILAKRTGESYINKTRRLTCTEVKVSCMYCMRPGQRSYRLERDYGIWGRGVPRSAISTNSECQQVWGYQTQAACSGPYHSCSGQPQIPSEDQVSHTVPQQTNKQRVRFCSSPVFSTLLLRKKGETAERYDSKSRGRLIVAPGVMMYL